VSDLKILYSNNDDVHKEETIQYIAAFSFSCFVSVFVLLFFAQQVLFKRQRQDFCTVCSESSSRCSLKSTFYLGAVVRRSTK